MIYKRGWANIFAQHIRSAKNLIFLYHNGLRAYFYKLSNENSKFTIETVLRLDCLHTHMCVCRKAQRFILDMHKALFLNDHCNDDELTKYIGAIFF